MDLFVFQIPGQSESSRFDSSSGDSFFKKNCFALGKIEAPWWIPCFFSGPDSDEGSYALFHGDRASQVRGFQGEKKGSCSVNTKIACI